MSENKPEMPTNDPRFNEAMAQLVEIGHANGGYRVITLFAKPAPENEEKPLHLVMAHNIGNEKLMQIIMAFAATEAITTSKEDMEKITEQRTLRDSKVVTH